MRISETISRTGLTALLCTFLWVAVKVHAQQLRIQSGFSATMQAHADVEVLAKRIDAQVLLPGSIVPPVSLFQAVANHTVSGGWALVSNYGAADAAFYALETGIPALPGKSYAEWRAQPQSLEIADRLYTSKGVKGISCGVLAQANDGLWLPRILPTETTSLKGNRIGVRGPLLGAIFDSLGASTAFLPLGEMYIAMESGTFDGVISSTPEIDLSLRLPEVAKHYYPLHLAPVRGIDLIINLAQWQRLSSEKQQTITMACKELSARMSSQIPAGMPESFKAAGVMVLPFPPSLQASLEARVNQMHAEASKASTHYAALMASSRDFMSRPDIRLAQESGPRSDPHANSPGNTTLAGWDAMGVEWSYSGGIANGRMHGTGVQIFRTGERYEGEFSNGLRHGHGVVILPDGKRFEDQFVNGQSKSMQRIFGKPAETTLTGRDSDGIDWIYTGEATNGRMQGRGVQIWRSGARYEGNFANGLRHGYGVQTWPDGEHYEGEFVNGRRTGNGVFIWPSGSRHEGRFVDGKRTGPGTLRLSNGKVFKGQFQDGELQN